MTLKKREKAQIDISIGFVLSTFAKDTKNRLRILLTLSPMWRIILMQEKFVKNKFCPLNRDLNVGMPFAMILVDNILLRY